VSLLHMVRGVVKNVESDEAALCLAGVGSDCHPAHKANVIRADLFDVGWSCGWLDSRFDQKLIDLSEFLLV